MPRIVDLGASSERLRDVNLIIGEGLCSNIYVLGRRGALIVDTGVGNSLNPVWPQLHRLGVRGEDIAGVALTHAHHDHVGGVLRILERATPRVYIHRLDATYIASSLGPLLRKVDDGDIIDAGPWPLRVVWTPGHTRGSICLYSEEMRLLLSGDTVFPGGHYGRYDGETGSREEIVNSLMRLTSLDVEVMLPGHGTPVLEGAWRHIRQAYLNASTYTP
ncbi:MAG: MBL fold metallo-hydrolase [Candidatus Bathyarchaeia archaeon]|nr:MBL fold metallo-hydrolase [Candidatus Bathyarchaeota archaeon]